MLKHLEKLVWLEPRYLVTAFMMELLEFINTQGQPKLWLHWGLLPRDKSFPSLAGKVMEGTQTVCLHGNHCDSSGYQGGPCQSFSLSGYRGCTSSPSHPLQVTSWAQAEHCPPGWHSTASYRTAQASKMAQTSKNSEGICCPVGS